MMFTQDVYTVSETNRTVAVCFTHDGEFERNVTVLLFTEDISAVEGTDYEGVSVNIMFDMQGTFCTNLVLIEDTVLEEEEALEVNLRSNDSAVNFTLSRAEVRILDSNRECSCDFHHTIIGQDLICWG